MWLVVGLGNPGQDYAESRHNVGFMVVNQLWKRWRFPRWQRKYRSKVSLGLYKKEEVFLALPQTYMNRSGEAVILLMTQLKLPLTNLLVIYDDLDLPLGKIRIRKTGGPGTHRGMQSVVTALGGNAFPRIRIGIGPLPEKAEAAAYVLEPFSEAEKVRLIPSLEAACEAVEMILDGAIDQAMNKYNRTIV
ncbi:MAG: aminoacyl-tRNA hydrolase [Candidatus Aminicenantes bacterium]|nr:aminoacyl-tRNA hydrolase [Candidatus Aminicenantes bacterium]